MPLIKCVHIMRTRCLLIFTWGSCLRGPLRWSYTCTLREHKKKSSLSLHPSFKHTSRYPVVYRMSSAFFFHFSEYEIYVVDPRMCAMRLASNRPSWIRHPKGKLRTHTVSHWVIRKHPPWDQSQTRFSSKTWGAPTPKKVTLKRFRREGCIHRHIARRNQYALPVTEKPSVENRRGVCVILSP